MSDTAIDTAQSETLFQKLESSIATLEADPVEKVETEVPEEVVEQEETVTETQADGDAVEETDEKPEVPEADAEFVASLKKFGVSIDPEDVPEAAREAFVQKVKHMESGFTKAMQEQRAYRQEKASFEADKQRLDKDFDKVVADRLMKDPTLVDKINEEVEKRKNPVYAEALELRRDADRMKAEQDVRTAQDQSDANVARGQALLDYAKRQAKTSGIPWDFVEGRILFEDTQRGLDESDIDTIVAEKAKVYSQHVAAVKGAKTREIVKQKVADRDAAKRKGTVTGNNTAGTPAPTVDLSKLSPSDRLRARIEASLDSMAA
jgi:hypothetical protein